VKAQLVTVLALVLSVFVSPTTFATTTDYVDFEVLVVIYTHYEYDTVEKTLGDQDKIDIHNLLDGQKEFVWRASNCNCNFAYVWDEDVDVVVIPGDDQGGNTLTPDFSQGDPYNDFYDYGGGALQISDERVALDLDGLADLSQYSLVIVFWAHEPTDEYYAAHAGGTWGVDYVVDHKPWLEDAGFISIPLFAKNVDWDYLNGVIKHECNNYLFSVFLESGLQTLENPTIFPDPEDPAQCTYMIDTIWDFRFQSLKHVSVQNWLALDDRWAKERAATDTDGDGIPDNAADPSTPGPLAITEQKLGTSTSSGDSDTDELSELDELVATYHDPADPLDPDTDGDLTEDGDDPFPLYNMTNEDFLEGAPTVDGTIEAAEWVEIAHFNGTAADLNGTCYAAWEGNSLYLAFEIVDDQVDTQFTGDDSENFNDLVQVKIDAGLDGWRHMLTQYNYRLRIIPKDDGYGECEMWCRDFYADSPNDPWHTVDTSALTAKYTITASGYMIEVEIPESALDGLSVGSGEQVRLSFGVDDFDPVQWDWRRYDVFTGYTWDETGFVVINLTSGGGPGGGVETVGQWTSGSSHDEESGTDRLLVLTVHCEDGNSGTMNATGATYGGEAMTKVDDYSYTDDYEAYVAVFVLDDAGINAASGTSFNVTWQQSPSATAAYSSVFLQNVNQSSPTGATSGAGSTNSTVSASSLATSDGDMVITVGTVGNSGDYTSVGSGFTEAIEVSPSSADGVAAYKSATGANETPSVTHSNVNRHVVLGLVVKAGGGGGEDTTPPEPDPMTWATVPYATGSTSISMTATTATDDSDVEYLFDCTAGGGHDSGWQDSTTYEDTNLSPSTQYSYRVMARDKSANQNETGWSGTESATTQAGGGGDVTLLGSWVANSSHTKPSGTDRALVLTLHVEDGDGTFTASSVTYGGQTMTKVVDQSATSTGYYAYVAVYVLNEAGVAAASSGTFSITWTGGSAPDEAWYASAFFENVNQSVSPTNWTDASNGGTTNPITIGSLGNNSGDKVVATGMCGQGGYNADYDDDFNAGFTKGGEAVVNSTATTIVGHKAGTGSSESPVLTWSGSSFNRQAGAAIVVPHN
jgi:hypothetical protein